MEKGNKLLPDHVIINKLKDRKLNVVIKNTGVSYHSLKKIQNGYSKDVNLKILQTISDYLSQ